MLTLIRLVFSMLGGMAPARLALLVVLLVLSSTVDSLGIVFVFSLFKIIVEPESASGSRALTWGEQMTGLSGNSFLVLLCAALLALFALKAAVQISALVVRLGAEVRLRTLLAERLFGSYLRAPYSVHLRRTSSELTRNVHSNAGTCVVTLLSICDLFGDMLLLVGISVTLLTLQPVLALGAMVLFSTMGALYLWITRRYFNRLGEVSNSVLQETYRAVVEPLNGVKQIKVLGAEDFFTANYVRLGRILSRVAGTNIVMQQSLRPVFELVIVLGLIGPVMVAMLKGQSAAGIVPVLAMFGTAAYRLLPSLLRATSVLQSLRFSGPAIEAVHEDLCAARRGELAAPADLCRIGVTRELRLDQIGFRYDAESRPALADISLSIRHGQAIGIVGPSGAGKTTLVDVMLGLLTPTSGRILLDGRPLSPPRPIPSLFGYVPQDGFIVNDSVRRNIAMGIADRDVDERRLQQAIDAASLTEVIAGLPQGLDTVVGDHGVRLSGGQRQRLAIARALYRESEILILDEATSALDPVTEADISAAVEQLHGKKTLVLVAHRLSTVKHCDAIFLLDAGRIADCGTFDELLVRNARFRDMVSKLDVGASATAALG